MMTSAFIFANKNILPNRNTSIDFHKIKKKSMSSTNDTYFKKKKQTNYGTILQNLKLDLNFIKKSIEENCDILIYYKNPKM